MSGTDVITPMLITFNEAANIDRTLGALGWAKQILVIDSGSTDGTLDSLAADPRVRVVYRRFDTFAGQCNYGLSEVATPWVLSMDADYVLTPGFVEELSTLDLDGDVAGYVAGFRYCIDGRPLRGTLYPPRCVLYRTGRGRYSDYGHGHKVAVDGVVGRMRGRILHDDRKPLDRWLNSQRNYARQEADYLMSPEAFPGSLGDRVRRMVWPAAPAAFVQAMLFKGCILDGRAGWTYALQRVHTEVLVGLELLDRRARKRADG
ncbi:MAG: glycosyltransferase family 2 protein [Pseudomonadota bacterium]|nr:glycosyltransferase family 2 protein [Pseudomonadota bacterium]